jgi:formylglycine-generating enzyme
MKSLYVCSLVASLFVRIANVSAVTVETVAVGNPGNAADAQVMIDGTSGYGAVSYEFRIGKYEITNAQYTEFLNWVASSDPYELYDDQMASDTRGGVMRSGLPGNYTYAVKADAVGRGPEGTDYDYANKPVVFVSWSDALRFVNWLNNGQQDADTESGAYTLLGGTPTLSNFLTVSRTPNAKWFLPSEDEWYKAAYHKNDGATANYWDYATATDVLPDNNFPSSDTGNSANFSEFLWTTGGTEYTTGSHEYPLTDVGAYSMSQSPYGVFDQTGNVFEWNESRRRIAGLPDAAGLRGGAWAGYWDYLLAEARGFGIESGSSIFGFRVASSTVPEPTSIALLCLGSICLLRRR